MIQTQLAAILRKLAAHLDEADTARPPSRRAGKTQSPYACDFEIDEDALRNDLAVASVRLAALLPDREGVA